ncbi:DUF3144 domain-containing protein [Cupriavidus campinensis]|uniref:DUF3144 domain-containing protein n=1 Tax=Cupriavidus campinensis TaxID=151783 RepID=UPI0024C46C37|nr:DUF3144 domain-containing protein [Cupriavidus campinensis]
MVKSKYTERAHTLNLSNEQLGTVESQGKLSASMMYGSARFNAWGSARGFASGEATEMAKEETINYFCEQYRLMFEENIDGYIKNFSSDLK